MLRIADALTMFVVIVLCCSTVAPCDVRRVTLAMVLMTVWGQVAQICHTRWECAVVPPAFARYHNYGSSGGERWFRVGETNALLGSRHANIYSPLRRRTILH